jgi:hypothetical protein
MSIVQVREHLYGLLTGDATLVAMLGTATGFTGVYDEAAPEGAPYDFIVIGSTSDADAQLTYGSADREGGEDIRIHTRPGPDERVGAAKAKAIFEKVKALVSGVSTALASGHTLEKTRLDLVTTFLEPDRITTTATARYSFRLMKQ